MSKRDASLGAEKERWERLFEKDEGEGSIDQCLGRIKRQAFFRFLLKHAGGLEGRVILKTDLREEAHGEDRIFGEEVFARSSCYGVEISFRTARQALLAQKEVTARQSPVVADVRALPFADGVFDLIISTSTLDHFEDASDIDIAFAEIGRVLRPGGRAVITLNNKRNINFVCMSWLERVLGKALYPVRFFTLDQVEGLALSSGLSVRAHDHIVNIINPMNTLLLLIRRYWGDRSADRLGGVCTRIADALSRSTLRGRTSWFIAVICEKTSRENGG